MDVIGDLRAFREACDRARDSGRTLGFVPTMGAFHEGHRSLLRRARAERDVVAVSIFVNPLQFGPAEDLTAYPRDLDRDLAEARAEGVDLVLAPEAEAVWLGGKPHVTVDPGPVGDRLEGATRPGHFRGVLTVVAKLLHLSGPCRAYFGEKDAQQLFLVRRMVGDLAFPVEVVGCPTVREPDGLAMSSRNVYLSSEERAAAGSLSAALRVASEAAAAGERDVGTLVEAMADRVGAEPLASLDYAEVVDDETWDRAEAVDRPVRALLAVRIGGTRLIDNARLEPPAP
jgi:pantoate--beta-alanine ligase